MAKLIRIHPDNPQEKAIDQVVEVLKQGGLIIYPSDTVYGLGCDITNYKAMENLARLKGVKLDKSQFSIVCNDLSHLSNFTRPISNSTFKVLKRALPGPFTFVLQASGNLPLAYKGKKTVGIRVPDHLVPRRIVEKLGNPIASTSIYDEDEILEYTTDPELIAEKWDKLVDVVIDSGYGDNVASSIIDATENEMVILREGKGDINEFL
ncbi:MULTISPECIES: L-threonylcarbamoyladenylate synthase [Weeksella]|uniref:Sua5/YciO/YrdC/YwlC family protein n=1 Tax=Weeksella virosa (strain ATCC 43766 / DSM 16922 / JCM 21250 / CCUG 30538 / CDC 9751 / IAM 14551 / NBRC 16016 / NCTC 11634 / CL345/78) TaxID=865938 RepID=F0NZH2_WEEVC|nr:MULTISPECIES: L-threonylcarbamoyladenylate synthase [Weeksella]ADX68319.1 Sua5/YciO/YrdC/YwlC family protein [Weeksella virosa DSM 16922]MDK7374574.1 L-threonylcarbamoyladenylate synthase [Weeksella virosa]MDK7674723.1 L-threonylcarbamoyladenylate synthase [Weeksella virosa]OFM83105.1 threonylcarbamoyl-AMP synthase [Weeksella sp. HMSC059D05]SUP54638.1 Putative translation factor (SUA5) [Weeksella virosa]